MCFCPSHLTGWTRLTISDGRLVEAMPLEPLPPGAVPSLLGWQTVEDLFDRFESARRDDLVEHIEAIYDPTFGHPTSIRIVCKSTVADCGVSYYLRALTPSS